MSLAADKPNRKKSTYFATVPPQEILPIVNSGFESSVRGLYVIGDVTGLPLVKVAANQGVEVVTKMEAAGVFERRDADDERLDLVIIGGGPAGLSAAVEAEKRELKYVILERNKAASTVRSFPPGKKVYAEPQFIQNTSELDVDEDLDKDEFLERIGRHDLVIDRPVRPGAAVALAAELGNHLPIGAYGNILGIIEAHVFEEMGEPGTPGLLPRAAHVHQCGHGHDGVAVVFVKDDLEPVVENPALYVTKPIHSCLLEKPSSSDHVIARP